MYILTFIIVLLIPNVCSVSLCKNLKITGLGGPDLDYISINDYRGRPDFYSVGGGEFNLFGEEADDNSCVWRIDSTESLFPYWITSDCSFHPIDIDIDSVWFILNEGVQPVEVNPVITCLQNKKKISRAIISLIISLVCIFVTLVIVYMHVILRRNRIRKWKEKCPVCIKRVKGASSVIRNAFTEERRGSIG